MPLSEPICTIECDKCGYKDEYELTEMAMNNIWSNAGIKENAELDGWVFGDDGETVCVECATEGGE